MFGLVSIKDHRIYKCYTTLWQVCHRAWTLKMSIGHYRSRFPTDVNVSSFWKTVASAATRGESVGISGLWKASLTRWSRHWAVRTPCLNSSTSHFRSALASCLSDWRKLGRGPRAQDAYPIFLIADQMLKCFDLEDLVIFCAKWSVTARNEAAQFFLADRARCRLEMLS